MTHNLTEEEKQYAIRISDAINPMTCNTAKTAIALSNDHRTLIEKFGEIAIDFFLILSEDFADGYYDGRDEFVCSCAHEIKKMLDEKKLMRTDERIKYLQGLAEGK